MIRNFIAAAAVVSLAGCANVAKIENLPTSSDQVAFDRVAQSAVRTDGAWNLQTDFEYYREVDVAYLGRVHTALEQSLSSAGYELVRSDKERAVILGQRGIRLNEWNSVAGAYYKTRGSVVQIYIRSEITQDITGGWESNRAREIGDRLCFYLVPCNSQARVGGQ